MNHSSIISKINEFMFRLNEKMVMWLENRLPKITNNWWDELVINNLSDLQREHVVNNNIHEIKGLDLASLLRVFDRNWFVITSSFFVNNKERTNIRKMQEIRNSWAHITHNDITKEKVIADVETIIELLQTFDAAMKETRDLEEFIFDIEEDKDIVIEDSKKAEIYLNKVESFGDDEKEISIGSVVTLVSDASIVGAVIGINGDKYSVLINGIIQSFYKEQIVLKVEKNKSRLVPLKRVKSALTAYQINNPGASNLYSLNSARIDFVPYQFRPALKLIKSDTPRLLVADDVGVGKTIEAGLILKELEARSNINSALIICPRPLVAERKWETEMKRFDENFTQLDGKELQEALLETNRDGEWPERHNKTVIPYSLFNEDTIMGTQSESSKRKKNIGLSELDPLPHFDLVIVDEAHHIRNANTWMYKGVELFCRNADAVVFLTATPLQNSDNDLYTLLNLLRPDVIIDKETFNTMSEPNRNINNLLRVVRKQETNWQEEAKHELSQVLGTTWGRNVVQHNPNFEKIYNYTEKQSITREEKIELLTMIEGIHSFNNIINRTRRKDIEEFCIRRTLTLEVPFNEVQKNLYESLIEFESIALSQLHGSRSVRFMMCTIMRQAASCIYGLAPFLNSLVSKRLEQIQEDGELYEYDINPDNDYGNFLNKLAEDIISLSKELPIEDPKFEKMYEVILQKQKEENNKIIIFSSFRHSLRYIKHNLKERNIRVAQVDGSVPDEERYELRKRFMLDKNDKNSIDVLLFTEVGCEGLDYQFCDTMINYDLPWNPMRIEQRIGRIDRRGQKSDTVKIYNIITQETIDAVIYDRCLSKIGVFEASVGDCSEILGDISEQILHIMFDSELSEDERKLKIEQMADNEVMKVHEMRKLEQDEKSLFGFDLSNYIMNKDVQDAENPWISPQSIRDMTEMFLNDYLGEGEYIRGKSELKSLRLAVDKRHQLLSEFRKKQIINNNNSSKLWGAYLKSDKPTLQVTFDSVCAKDNRNVTFLTQMHPLVIQAAEYESKKFPCEIGISVNDTELLSGDYEFLIYAWKYVGLRPDIKMVAISDNIEVQKNILNYLQFASEYNVETDRFQSKWDSMDSLHYEDWQMEKAAYTKIVSDECNYRLDQMKHSYNQRLAIFRAMINNAEDEKIKRMRQSQLDKLENDYIVQKKNAKKNQAS
ncbi:MAG: ATP-dependent helicase HepA, partial [Clostridium butyricum]|nr:ATP-dependent helicase HepA [Clostridium butyricum]